MTTGNEDASPTVQPRSNSNSIPIPSFGSGRDEIVEEGAKISLSPHTTPPPSLGRAELLDVRRRIKIDLKKLSHIEHALQFFLARNRNRRGESSIHLNDFYNLLEVRDRDCRHEILCVMLTVAPELYKIKSEMGRIEIPGFGVKIKIDRMRQLKAAWKKVEGRHDYSRRQCSLVDSLLASRSGVRTLALLKACWTAHQTVSYGSKRTVADFQSNGSSLLDKDAHQVGLSMNKKPRREDVVGVTLSQQLEPFITANMTLEERVRARAEAKERIEQNQDDLFTSSNLKKACSKTDDEACREDLLQLADALRSHFRADAHLGVVRTAATIRELSRHLVGALSSVKFGGSRARRKDVIEKLYKLAKALPEWINIDGANVKHSVLTMKADVDFVKTVRAKLGGQYRQKSGPECADPKPSQSTVTNQIFAASMPAPCPRPKVKDEASFARVNKVMDVSISSLKGKKTSAAQKRSVTYQHPRQQTQQMLRINNDLIFGHRSEAEPMPGDSDFVVKKSVSEIGDSRSPNGLKRLFSEMNNGRRI